MQMPVPALKEQIAGVTGVLSEQQRLICRGRVLKDDQLLSAYRIFFVNFFLWVQCLFASAAYTSENLANYSIKWTSHSKTAFRRKTKFI